MNQDLINLLSSASLYWDPITNKPFNINNIKINDEQNTIEITLNYCASSYTAQYTTLLQPLFNKYYANYKIQWQINIKAQEVSTRLPRISSIKNIIAIMSGKGGV